MALPAEELHQARTALREVIIIQQRKRMWAGFVLVSLSMFPQTIVHHQAWFECVQMGIILLVAYLGVYYWRSERQAAKRYAGNLVLLGNLTKREPGLREQIGDPFAYQPMLDGWNRRLGQRALLWRVDRFLSCKR